VSEAEHNATSDRDAARAAVERAAVRLTELSTAQREAAADFSDALYFGYRAGLTWAELAEASGLASPATARSRAERSRAAGQRRRPGLVRPPSFDEDTIAITMSVAEAAREFGVSEAAIYARVRRGGLQAVHNEENGRVRILRNQQK
jgi:hypothetical protein